MMMKGEESSKAGIERISSIKSEEEEEDRISSLPDCLLLDIISRLGETKYAIRTGTLSKRWQHLWTKVPNLIFLYFGNDFPQFHSSVERIISQSNNLTKLQLHSNYTDQTKSHVNNCIRNAITHNVQIFDFYMSYYLCYCDDYPCDCDTWFVLPECFFVSSCFIHLKLSHCVFKHAVVVSWENLRTLHIQDAGLDKDVIENILSGSPLLETLMLSCCYGFGLLDITNKSVKNLVFSGYDDIMYPYSVEINAPYTLSLTIKGCLVLEKLLLLNVSSVIKAELDYHCESLKMCDDVKEEMLKGLLLSLGHVKEVKIGDYCLEVQLSFYLAICGLVAV